MDRGNARKEHGKGLEESRQASHVERACHEKAVGRAGVANVGTKVWLGDIIFGHFLTFAAKEPNVEL